MGISSSSLFSFSLFCLGETGKVSGASLDLDSPGPVAEDPSGGSGLGEDFSFSFEVETGYMSRDKMTFTTIHEHSVHGQYYTFTY